MQQKEPGRNDPCPCGSGLKYKKCCALKKPAAPKGRFTAKVLSSTGQIVLSPQPLASLSGRKITKLSQQEAAEWKMTQKDYRPETPAPEPEAFGSKELPPAITETPINPDADFEGTSTDYRPPSPKKKKKGT